MTIQSISVWNLKVPFRDGPYAMSHVVQDSIFGRLYCFQTSDGAEGWGEAVFTPSLTEDQRADCLAGEASSLRSLLGQNLEEALRRVSTWGNLGKAWGGIVLGVETAIFDLQSQALGVSMAAHLGAEQRPVIEDYFSVSEKSTERVTSRIREAGPKRAVIQLKLGVGDIGADRELLAVALAALAPQQTLLADANGGWDPQRAAEMIQRYDDQRIIWEEPCSDYDLNIALAEAHHCPIMVDQCVGQKEIALSAVSEAKAHSLCIKPAFLGGLSVAQEVRDRAAAAGMLMRIDGPWCGTIATAAILQLASGAPQDQLIAGCDLREPLALQSSFPGIEKLPDGKLRAPAGPGLGVTPSRAQLGPATLTLG